ncbi:SpoIIE family protein phosphatase [Spiractinospora alimapuensis]|uniref:ATP-binding SpoIIE family protein phosphatase n=1 Tax=Spiractinospora alimapuensis TaxID=2820884 RepID=UPI001F362847|nr:SpoIIE family protein phosphatase [Spiractinospora alimapuensis]QVQ50658.1 SpoIIE family protein phosphatase [Spiractinospora alimapuensis]
MKGWEDHSGGGALSTDTVLSRAQIATLVLDQAGRLRSMNRAAEDLFDLSPDRDVVGTLADVGVHAADHELARDLIRQVAGGNPWEGTLAVVRGDATWMYVQVQGVPLRDPSAPDRVDGILVLVRPALESGRTEESYGLLDRIGSRLANSLEFEATLKEVAGILVPQFADHCFIDLFEGDRLIRRVSVHAESWSPPPRSWSDVGEEVYYPPNHFAATAMRNQETILVRDFDQTGDEPGSIAAKVSEQVGVTSGIAAPLRARGELLGVLMLGLSSLSPRTRTRYHGFDRDMVGVIASRVALAIDNARLFEEERSTALAFQKDLLPHEFPNFDGLSIAHRYIPARPLEVHGHGIQTQVGGDFYDVIPLSAGRVGIVVGDVEGRGPHAAAVMGQVRAAIRAFAQADREPADIMRELDEWVRQLGRPGPEGERTPPRVSCLYLVYDAWLRELFYANAGHAAPLLIVDGEVDDLALEVSDALLGGVKPKGIPYDSAAYHQAQLTLPARSTLLLYTDGLLDRKGHGGSPDPTLSLNLLRDRLRDVADADVERIAQAAVNAIPGESDDDTALLVVRSHPSELGLRESWFVAEAETVGDARHMATDTFDAWGMEKGQADLASLLVSEVVTNVVLHAAPASIRRDFSEVDGIDFGADSGDEFSEDWSDLLEGGAAPAGEDLKREFLLRLRHGAASVWVEVFDYDLRLPRIRTATADDEGGRGLYLVDQLASRWGSRPTPEGKFVWFEIPMREEA